MLLLNKRMAAGRDVRLLDEMCGCWVRHTDAKRDVDCWPRRMTAGRDRYGYCGRDVWLASVDERRATAVYVKNVVLCQTRIYNQHKLHRFSKIAYLNYVQ